MHITSKKLTVRKVLRYLLVRLGEGIVRLGRSVYRTPIEVRTAQWFKDNGDNTLRLDYDLNEHSLVFDLGGYKGHWSRDIHCKYRCRIHVFEPVSEFAKTIRNTFVKNRMVTVHDFGLSSVNSSAYITLGDEGSSTFVQGKHIQEIKLVKAADFFKENNVNQIDLMKINIEGGEYDLIEHLIDTGFIKKITDVQVQFHDFVPDAENRMARIQKALSKTHYLTYQYPYVWENWSINLDVRDNQ